MAASDSLEKTVAFGLESGWGNLLASIDSVRSFTSGLGWGKVEFALGDLLLEIGRQVVVLGEEGLDVVISFD
jgi:hypothetical protein